jgi:hypothetical protein
VSSPKIAALNDGTVVVTWSECIAEGECSIFAQRFTVTPEADCPGDCNRDGQVTVDELVVGVELALHGEEELTLDLYCLSIDTDSDCAVSVSELVSALNYALNGCD